jgi:uncharacterized membrane protein
LNKQEVIAKIQTNLSEQDKIDIFNWYIQNESPEIIAMFEQTGNREFKLSEQHIDIAKSGQGEQMLEYSMIKIREELGIKRKSNLNLMKFLLGFR